MRHDLADTLNRACDCVSTDMDALTRLLGDSMPEGWAQSLVASHPNLFAPLPVFVGAEELEAMRATIAAVERVVALPAYVERVLAGADDATRHASGARGVFFGYDFHLGQDGPRLIEVNTNAGGALLQLALAKAQRPCCAEVKRAFDVPYDMAQLEDRIMSMFREELALARPGAELRHVAIVDEHPEEQFLRPEFELFVALLGSAQLSVYLVFRQRVPRERMVTVLEAIARVNHGLLVGSYEVDIEEGFVRLKAGLDFTGTELSPALVLNLVTTVRDISNVYDEAITSVMNAELTPSEAIALVEG